MIFIVVLIVYDFSYDHILGGRFDVGKTCLTPPHFYAPVLSQKNVGHRSVLFILKFWVSSYDLWYCAVSYDGATLKFGAIQSLLNGVDFHLLKTIR